MDYEKAYKEALERAKNFIENGDERERTIAESIFVGLMEESEDEKWIPKEIAKYLKEKGDFRSCWIVWLEKQGEHINHNHLEKKGEQNEQSFWEKCNRCKYFDGYDICLHKKNCGTVTDGKKENCKNNGFFIEKHGEQKPIDKVGPKFKVGDWVLQENIGVYKVIEICKSWYEVIDFKDNHYSISFDDEYMCHFWTIQDAKDGDVLVGDEKRPFIFKGLLDIFHPECPVAYCGIDSTRTFSVSTAVGWWTDEEVQLATKEQRDILFQKMKEAGYEWDAEKKELKKIEQESAWSEDGGQKYSEDSCKKSNDIAAEEKDMTEYKKGFECGKQRVLKYPEDFNLCEKSASAWSEEDEKKRKSLIKGLEDRIGFGWASDPFSREEYIDWLKSLKERMKGE